MIGTLDGYLRMVAFLHGHPPGPAPTEADVVLRGNAFDCINDALILEHTTPYTKHEGYEHEHRNWGLLGHLEWGCVPQDDIG